MNEIVYDIWISLNSVFVFELWIGFNLMPRTMILRNVLHFCETRQIWRNRTAPKSIHTHIKAFEKGGAALLGSLPPTHQWAHTYVHREHGRY